MILQGRNGAIAVTDDPPRRGGQAEVFRGRDSRGRTVAVKIARPGEAEAEGLRGERAALLALHARHPDAGQWLVPILDHGTSPDGRPFLVLPWFERSLQDWLRDRRPSLAHRLDALVSAAEAVVRLHRSAASLAGVVLHRDLKPGNFLVEEGPAGLRVVLADLGGVKERGLEDVTRNSGIHTPHFAPVEQALPLERPPDPSVDVHALAVLVYVVLVGRPPQAVMARAAMLTDAGLELLQLHSQARSEAEEPRYGALRRWPLGRLVELDAMSALSEDDGRRLEQALLALVEGEGAGSEGRAEGVAEALLPVLRQALEPDPARRLGQPERVLSAILAARGRLGVRAVEVLAQAEQEPVRRRRGTPVFAVGCALMAVVLGSGGVGIAWWGWRRQAPTPVPVRVEVAQIPQKPPATLPPPTEAEPPPSPSKPPAHGEKLADPPPLTVAAPAVPAATCAALNLHVWDPTDLGASITVGDAKPQTHPFRGAIPPVLAIPVEISSRNDAAPRKITLHLERAPDGGCRVTIKEAGRADISPDAIPAQGTLDLCETSSGVQIGEGCAAPPPSVQ